MDNVIYLQNADHLIHNALSVVWLKVTYWASWLSGKEAKEPKS